MINKKDIIEYYDKSKVSYKDVWHLDSCLALHYGFWGKGVHNLKQALYKENKILAKTINIKSTDFVLDAGCGVGGSSIYLSKKFNCHVCGITLSKKQVADASQAAKQHGVADLVNFSVADFHNTSFENNSFDVVWFVESFCHSDNPNKLLMEMHRILKPNGRIIIADAFLSKKNYNEKNKLILKKWLNSWAVNSVPNISTVNQALLDNGFEKIKIFDYSKKISRSSFLLYFYANLALAYGQLRRLIGKSYGNNITIKNTIGAKFQYLALRKKLWQYNVVSATIPTTKIDY
ncbi:MAG: methyltransferase domain-containing protein [Bacteroidetes bacterium]|nr:methyltransferase domain-containing protein [Bacteroidota bacterium]